MKRCGKSATGGDYRDPSAVCCVSEHTKTSEMKKPAMICRRDSQTAGCPDACYSTCPCTAEGHKGRREDDRNGISRPLDLPSHTSMERVFQGFSLFLVFLQLRAVKNHEGCYTKPELDGDFAVCPSTFLPSEAGSRGFSANACCRGSGFSAEASKISDRFGRWCTGGRIRCTVNTSIQ